VLYEYIWLLPPTEAYIPPLSTRLLVSDSRHSMSPCASPGARDKGSVESNKGHACAEPG